MALCSYDNELNQKYNINKELIMTQAVKDLIAVAVATTEYETNVELKDAVEKLEALGDNAKGDTQEYKNLKALIEEAEAKEKADALEQAKLAEEAEATTDMNILEAFEVAEKVGKVARRGWDVELSSHFVTIKRGETKPSLHNGSFTSPFTPSIEDVMTVDWYNVEEEV